MTDEEFAQWKAARDKAVGGTLEEFTQYSIVQGQSMSDPAIYEIMWHKCRTSILSLPVEMRQASHKWLIEHQYTSWADEWPA